MQKVKTQRSGELFVKNMLIFNFYMVIIKNYKVKKLFNKFPEIFGKIGINFWKFPDIFRGKFSEISELTTLTTSSNFVRRYAKIGTSYKNIRSVQRLPVPRRFVPQAFLSLAIR